MWLLGGFVVFYRLAFGLCVELLVLRFVRF